MSPSQVPATFRGRGEERRALPTVPEERQELRDPAQYITDEGLRQAVDVAMALGKPLLITGDPGTGKTQLAHRIAYEFSTSNPPDSALVFHTKTTSTASDLFYTYDNLRHFQDVQMQKPSIRVRDYIRFQALGLAILRAEDPNKSQQLLPKRFRVGAPTRTVVLLDEIDKAPRDLPNDILNEIEDLSFSIRELDEELAQLGIEQPFRAARTHAPVVVLTSNSERDLPDAFLRRCIFYYIPFPDKDRLIEILKRRVPLSSFGPDMLANAVERFEEIRSRVKRKKPSTEELISWVRVLDRLGIDPKNPKAGQAEALAFTYCTLVKSKEDLVDLSK